MPMSRTPRRNTKGQVPLWIWTDKDIDDWIRKRAEREGRTIKSEVNRILRKHMAMDETAS
jgi:DNA polymerase III delta subunit